MTSFAGSIAFAIAATVVAVGILMMPFALLVVAMILRQRRSPASSLTRGRGGWLCSGTRLADVTE